VDFVVRNICPPTFNLIHSSAILFGGEGPTRLDSELETSVALAISRFKLGSATPAIASIDRFSIKLFCAVFNFLYFFSFLRSLVGETSLDLTGVLFLCSPSFLSPSFFVFSSKSLGDFIILESRLSFTGLLLSSLRFFFFFWASNS